MHYIYTSPSLTNSWFRYYLACEQALCLGKKIARKGKGRGLFPLPNSPLDQRPVHRLGTIIIIIKHTQKTIARQSSDNGSTIFDNLGSSQQTAGHEELFFQNFNPLFPKSDQHQFSPNNIYAPLWERILWPLKGKRFDLLSNSLDWFFKEMYEDQSGEFIYGY